LEEEAKCKLDEVQVPSTSACTVLAPPIVFAYPSQQARPCHGILDGSGIRTHAALSMMASHRSGSKCGCHWRRTVRI